MSDALATFFKAWGTADDADRAALIKDSCSPDVTYSDPRSDGRLSGVVALTDYVGLFSANAPGWTASVVTSDAVDGYTRAIVAFGGTGPDGSEMVQHGTYFSETTNDKLSMIAGFVGVSEAP